MCKCQNWRHQDQLGHDSVPVLFAAHLQVELEVAK